MYRKIEDPNIDEQLTDQLFINKGQVLQLRLLKQGQQNRLIIYFAIIALLCIARIIGEEHLKSLDTNNLQSNVSFLFSISTLLILTFVSLYFAVIIGKLRRISALIFVQEKTIKETEELLGGSTYEHH